VKYTVEMGSVTMVYTPSVIKIYSDIQMLIWGGGFTHAHRMEIAKAYFRKVGYKVTGKVTLVLLILTKYSVILIIYYAY
jgi:hypothetical protein